MKRRQTTVLLLSMALVITSLSGCAREDLAEVRSKTQTDAVQEEVLLSALAENSRKHKNSFRESGFSAVFYS